MVDGADDEDEDEEEVEECRKGQSGRVHFPLAKNKQGLALPPCTARSVASLCRTSQASPLEQ